MDAGHLVAEEKYAALRDAVYGATMDRYDDLEAKAISLQAAAIGDSWKQHAFDDARPYRATWDWRQAFSVYRNKPNRFEIALWRSGSLGALCYGQTSKTNNRVRLDLIESSPRRPNPLGKTAVPILTFASSIFAELTGACEVWILDPYIELERLYQREGFGSRARYHGARMGQRRVL